MSLFRQSGYCQFEDTKIKLKLKTKCKNKLKAFVIFIWYMCTQLKNDSLHQELAF